MNEIYVVKHTAIDDDETIVNILNNQFFTEKGKAQEAMTKDFNDMKSDLDDGIDNIDTDLHSPDSVSLMVNNGEVSHDWEIIRLTDEGYSDEQ